MIPASPRSVCSCSPAPTRPRPWQPCAAALGSLDQPLQVRSNREIRAQSLEIFDRTFAITRVLRLLAIGVAFVGVFSALMALQLERTREHAVLRATGVTPGQLSLLTLLQTGLMGSVRRCAVAAARLADVEKC